MVLALTTPPVIEPVTVAECKDHLRILHNDEDTLIEAYMKAAREWCEAFTCRQFLTATYTLSLDDFPCWEINLYRAQIQSVSSVQYYDSGGTLTTISSSRYIVDSAHEPGRVVPEYGLVWPVVRLGRPNAVIVTFIAGWSAASLVPDSIKIAIKQLVSHWYENREPVVVGSITAEIPKTVEFLLWPYRINGIPQ